MLLPYAKSLLVFPFCLSLLLVCQTLQASENSGLVHYMLSASVSLTDATVTVSSHVALPAKGPDDWSFALSSDATPTVTGNKARLERLPTAQGSVTHYRVTLPPGEKSFSLAYQLPLNHQPDMSIDSVFLSGADYWYPVFAGALLSFDLDLRLPDGWLGLSQGHRELPVADKNRLEHWTSATPQEQIYLVAGPFNEYSDTRGDLEAMALLRQPDEALANQYLAATHYYVGLYEKLLGDYPYGKFALVENAQETGYGMPSFTLLGSRVMRLPFILHSSYPHEILHNWWGNGVYTHYAGGNWAEGLTSYMADHMLREQQGLGVQYRRDTLQKYADFVEQQDDFPLTHFSGGQEPRSRAVGYGKSLMVFHMLRQSLGDATFIQGLRRFYQDNLFNRAGFASLEEALSAVSGEPLEPFFRQWVEQAGAPQLNIIKATSARHEDGFQLSFTVEQSQPGKPYSLELPLAVTLEGQDEAWQTTVLFEEPSQQFSLILPARPLHLEVDPQFDIFRRLHPAETPPSVSQALGAQQLLVVLPDAAPTAIKDAYRSLAESWRSGQTRRVDIVTDAEISALPSDRGVWLLGWQNRFRGPFTELLANYEYRDQGDQVKLAGQTLLRGQNAVVVMTRAAAAPQHALGWLAAEAPAAVNALARKLRHYGSYSYLAFEGGQANNILRDQWPVLESPLSQAVIHSDGAVPDYQRAAVKPGAALVVAPAGSTR